MAQSTADMAQSAGVGPGRPARARAVGRTWAEISPTS